MGIPILGYWDIRGNTEPIRLLLHHAGVEFVDKRYQYGPAPDFSRQHWLNDKFKLGLDFPNLPYLLDGNLKLTQSIVILRHLGRKHGLVSDNEEQQTRIELCEQQAVDFRVGLTAVCYNQTQFEQLREEYLKTINEKLSAWAKFLGESQYVAGDKLTYVDFLLYDVLDIHRIFEPNCLNGYNNLKQYLERIEKQPNVAKYLSSGKYHKLPYNGAMAKWGNKRELN